MDRRDKIDVELMSNAMWHGTLLTNAPGQFVNKMEPPLDFGDVEWDVAVASVHYEHTWRQVNTYQVGIALLYPMNEEMRGSGSYGEFQDNGDAEDRIVFDLPLGPNRAIRKLSVPAHVYAGKKLKRADGMTMEVKLADDQEAESVGIEIAEYASRWYREKYKVEDTILKYEFNAKKRRSMFTSPLAEIVLYMEGASQEVCRILGFSNAGVERLPKCKLIRINKALQADHPPLCPRPSSLLIYSKIANDQRCGDANVQLLARVPVKSKFGELVQYDFHLLNFKALKYGLYRIEEIEIQINDHAGNPVDFTSGVTSISLIFKKHNKY